MAKCEILVGYNTPQKKPILPNIIGNVKLQEKIVNFFRMHRIITVMFLRLLKFTG